MTTPGTYEFKLSLAEPNRNLDKVEFDTVMDRLQITVDADGEVTAKALISKNGDREKIKTVDLNVVDAGGKININGLPVDFDRDGEIDTRFDGSDFLTLEIEALDDGFRISHRPVEVDDPNADDFLLFQEGNAKVQALAAFSGVDPYDNELVKNPDWMATRYASEWENKDGSRHYANRIDQPIDLNGDGVDELVLYRFNSDLDARGKTISGSGYWEFIYDSTPLTGTGD